MITETPKNNNRLVVNGINNNKFYWLNYILQAKGVKGGANRRRKRRQAQARSAGIRDERLRLEGVGDV